MSIIEVTDNEDSSWEAMVVAVWRAAGSGDLGRVRALKAAGAPLDKPAPPFDESPLMAAAVSNHSHVVDYLLNSGVKPDSVTNSSGLKALAMAARAGAADCVSVLLNHGASVKTRDQFGKAPLHWAAEFAKSADCVAALLEAGADVNEPIDNPAMANHGATALHLACLVGNVEAVRALMKGGAHALMATDYPHSAQYNAAAGLDPMGVGRALKECGVDMILPEARQKAAERGLMEFVSLFPVFLG